MSTQKFNLELFATEQLSERQLQIKTMMIKRKNAKQTDNKADAR